MLRLLKNTTSRLVFAGLALILAFSITFLPGVFAAYPSDFMTAVAMNTTSTMLEDGTVILNYKLLVKTAGSYNNLSGHFYTTNEFTELAGCAPYYTITTFERGADLPENAVVSFDSATGVYSISDDSYMDFDVDDELINIVFELSPDAPLSSECTVIDYAGSFSVDVGGDIQDYVDDGHSYIGINFGERTPQDVSYTDTEIDKAFGDADFTNPLTETVVRGAITYSSDDENVATVDESTGAVHIVGAGTAHIKADVANWYGYAKTSASYTLNVDPKEISIVDASVPDKTYDGTTDSEVGTVTLSEAGLVQGVDYTVSGVLNDANVGVDRTATVTVTLIGDAANNYVLTSNIFEVDDVTVSPYAVTSGNIYLEYYTVVGDGTEKQPGVNVKIGDFTVDPNEYIVSYRDNITVGTAYAVVTAKDNMNIVTATGVEKPFEITDKYVLSITGISTPQNITYTGLPVVLEGTLTVGDNTDGITVDDLTTTWYIYINGGWEITTQPTGVGIYRVVYSYDGPNYAGSLEVDFDIDRAVSPDPAELGGFEIEAGKRLSDIEGIRTFGFAWDDEDTIVERGRNTYFATYTYNNDPVNYTTLQLRIPVNGLYTPDHEPAPTPTPGGDDGTITVPDTGRFTNTNSGANNTITFVGFALMGLALVVLVSGRFARNKIDFDKK